MSKAMNKFFSKYGKKAAIGVFLFFLIKGLLWLVVIYFGATTIGSLFK